MKTAKARQLKKFAEGRFFVPVNDQNPLLAPDVRAIHLRTRDVTFNQQTCNAVLRLNGMPVRVDPDALVVECKGDPLYVRIVKLKTKEGFALEDYEYE